MKNVSWCSDFEAKSIRHDLAEACSAWFFPFFDRNSPQLFTNEDCLPLWWKHFSLAKFFFVSVKLFLLPEVFFAVFFSFWCFTSQFEVKQKNTIFVNPTDEVQIMDKQKKKESLCIFFLLEGKNPRLPCSWQKIALFWPTSHTSSSKQEAKLQLTNILFQSRLKKKASCMLWNV